MSPPRHSLVARGLWAGAAGGFAAGVLDGLLAWGRVAQFAPGLGQKALVFLHTGSLYAFFGALAGALVVAGWLALWRFTRFGWIGARGLALHDELRRRDPRDALIGLSLVLGGLPVLGAALAGAFLIGYQTILKRHHKGLIVAVAVAATVLLLLAALIGAFFVARVVELALRRLARGRAGRALSHPAAPLVAALVLLALGTAVAAAATWKTLSQLALRPYAAALGVAGATAVAFPLLRRWLARLSSLRANARLLCHAGLVGLCLAAALASGASTRARKAASAHTGLGGPLSSLVRAAVDLDGDGYSPLLGGGDCNDFDATIHPGAVDIPEDGIDQNCIGGDVKLGRRLEDVNFAPVPPSVPADFNVLLITIDTIRADHTSAYGYGRKTTPHLDRLARDGALFENGWAHAPSTRYSIPAILTGRYPSQILWDETMWWPGLRPENETLAEVLKKRGFHTGALLNYRYFEPRRSMNQGFDVYDNSNARLHHEKGGPATTRGSSSREQADAAVRFLEEHADKRFFLWVHFYDPHYEYERHPGIPSFGDRPIDLYDHEILWSDRHVGRILDRLRSMGLYDKTVIVVTGDHGEGFGEHGIDKHGYHLYSPQTKVPFVMRVPGLPPRRITMPVGHVDILPTLANLAGAEPTPAMLGRSLVDVLSGQADAGQDRRVFQEVVYEGPTERRAAVTKCWHLIYNVVPDNTFELYDICNDPLESRDVWGTADVDDLREALLAWIDESQYPPEAAGQMARALLKERPAPQLALDVRFGDAIKLLGVDLGTDRVRRGQSVDVTWYFESVERLAGDWRIFVHVEGPRRARFLGDHEPAEGALPVALWKPGQLIADRQHLTVPTNIAPGTYTIYMGFFQKNARLPIHGAGVRENGDRRLRVATLEVLP